MRHRSPFMKAELRGFRSHPAGCLQCGSALPLLRDVARPLPERILFLSASSLGLVLGIAFPILLPVFAFAPLRPFVFYPVVASLVCLGTAHAIFPYPRIVRVTCRKCRFRNVYYCDLVPREGRA